MEELRSLIKVSVSVIISLSYCKLLVSKLPPGKWRLFSVLPVLCIFPALPWYFSSIQLRTTSAFFLTWLAAFKLTLFCFDHGPLPSHQNSLLHFIIATALPIKTGSSSSQKPNGKNKFSIPLWVKFLVLGFLLSLYTYRQRLPHRFMLCLYSLHIYCSLEIVLAGAAALAQSATGLELEPQFDEPYLATSLQDFWGRRWNLMVSGVLRPAVYAPVRRWAGPSFGSRPAVLAGILSTFAVSGVMHEIMFYYLTATPPTLEVTCFFLLHGVCTAGEVVAKEAVVGRVALPAWASRAATLAFVAGSGMWLFFPPIVRSGTDVKAIQEYHYLWELLKKKYPA